MFQSLTSLASVALVSAMGSSKDIVKDHHVSSSEDEVDDNKGKKNLSRQDSTGSNGMTFSADNSENGVTNRAFNKM
mgnify:FL=1